MPKETPAEIFNDDDIDAMMRTSAGFFAEMMEVAEAATRDPKKGESPEFYLRLRFMMTWIVASVAFLRCPPLTHERAVEELFREAVNMRALLPLMRVQENALPPDNVH